MKHQFHQIMVMTMVGTLFEIRRVSSHLVMLRLFLVTIASTIHSLQIKYHSVSLCLCSGEMLTHNAHQMFLDLQYILMY